MAEPSHHPSGVSGAAHDRRPPSNGHLLMASGVERDPGQSARSG